MTRGISRRGFVGERRARRQRRPWGRGRRPWPAVAAVTEIGYCREIASESSCSRCATRSRPSASRPCSRGSARSATGRWSSQATTRRTGAAPTPSSGRFSSVSAEGHRQPPQLLLSQPHGLLVRHPARAGARRRRGDRASLHRKGQQPRPALRRDRRRLQAGGRGSISRHPSTSSASPAQPSEKARLPAGAASRPERRSMPARGRRPLRRCATAAQKRPLLGAATCRRRDRAPEPDGTEQPRTSREPSSREPLEQRSCRRRR
jgi:hypothetical protein